MTLLLWIVDLALCLSLIGLAWQTLMTEHLFKSIVLFMVFGLIMAIVWGRLEAPDIALVEAVIGAGLTGALFLSTLAKVSETGGPPKMPKQESES